MITGSIWVYNVEKEHHEHLEHLKHENGGVLPQPPDYEYLNRRVKPFPWGMNSLFFNPEVRILDKTFELLFIEPTDAGEQRFGILAVEFSSQIYSHCFLSLDHPPR